MRMRVFMKKLRVEIENENETKVYLESLDFEIEMRVSQKSESRYMPLPIFAVLHQLS